MIVNNIKYTRNELKTEIIMHLVDNQTVETQAFVGFIPLDDDDGLLGVMLDELTDKQLRQTVEAIQAEKFRPADIAHDIKGLSEHDKWFLPRVIGRNR